MQQYLRYSLNLLTPYEICNFIQLARADSIAEDSAHVLCKESL